MLKMRKFIKTLSVLLALVVALSAFSLTGFAAEGENQLKIGVCSDIHTEVVPEEEETFENGMYGNANSFINMHTLSFAIVDSCAKSVKEDGGQYLFICGDLTNNGLPEQYEEASQKLAQIEEKYDLKIIVAPGNHDYYYLKQDAVKAFRESFYNFGFDEAVVIDENTNSYVYNLDDKYTLIVMDTNDPGKTGDGMKDETYAWVKTQTRAAQAQGRDVMLMCHHPLMPHYLLGEVVTANFVLGDVDYRSHCEKFADWGIKYAFTGHSHINDIALYTSVLGNEIYDVNVPALVSAPASYRMATFTDENVKLEMKNVNSIDTSLVPKGYSDEAYERMANDFTAYSLDHYDASAKHFFNNILNTKTLLEAMGTPNDKALEGIVGGVCDRAKDVLFLPLYGEKDSFEAICKKYGVSVPESNYETMADVAIEAIKIFYGISDSEIDSKSAEAQIAVTGIGMLLTHVFADVPNDVKFSVIDAVLGMVGLSSADFGSKLTQIVLVGSDNPKYAFDVVHSIVDPILDGMLKDGEPVGSDLVLPAYSPVKTQMSVDGVFGVLKQIAQFVMNLLKYIYTILATALKW